MSITIKTYKTIADLRAATPDLPEDAVIQDRDGERVTRRGMPFMNGDFAPYTVTYEVPDTPAPLDPSRVKAGDRVTVRITDPETGTYEVSGHVWDRLGGAKMVGTTCIASWGTWRKDVTLTDHQPAPEPVDTLAETIWEAADTDFIEPLSKIAADKMAEAIRAKFAVIDLAKVDVDAMVSLVEKTHPNGRSTYSTLRIALDALGIEAS